MSMSKAYSQFSADFKAERQSNNAINMSAATVKTVSRDIERENARLARLQEDAEERGEIFDVEDYR